MDTNFDRILTRSQRRLSVESFDARDEDQQSNTGTPSKKSRATKRLSSKLEDVPEIGISSPLKMTQEENNAEEYNSPAKPLRGRRSLVSAIATSSKRGVANNPSQNLRRSLRRSPVDFDPVTSPSKQSSNQVSDSADLKNAEPHLQEKNSSPNKNILINKDILAVHSTFDSPKPKKNQREKTGSVDLPNRRRSLRLSTELNIVQEDPIREEETESVDNKNVLKSRRGKRLSTVPLQPMLLEEIEEPEDGNNESSNELRQIANYSSNVADIKNLKSFNISLTDISITEKSNKNISNTNRDGTKFLSDIKESNDRSSTSRRKSSENGTCDESERSYRMNKSVESSDLASNSKKGSNKSMTALSEPKSAKKIEKFNINSISLKEYSLRKSSDKFENMNSSYVMVSNHGKGRDAEDKTTIDMNQSAGKVQSPKLSNKSQSSDELLSNSNISKRSLRKSSINLSIHCTPEKFNNENSISLEKSRISGIDVSNLSMKNKRKSLMEAVTDHDDNIKDTSETPSDLQQMDKNVSLSDLSPRPKRKSTSSIIQDTILNTTPKNESSSAVMTANLSCHSSIDAKNNRKTAKDFFMQNTPNIDNGGRSNSKLSLNSGKSKKTIASDIATSTPNITDKEVAPKSLLSKPLTINLSTKGDSFDMNASNSNDNEVSQNKTGVNSSKLIEDLHMTVTEYAQTPAKNSDKSDTKVDKQLFHISDDTEDSDDTEKSEESIKLTFIDSASDAGSDYRSGDSMNESEREEIEHNEIVDKGKSLMTESSETDNDSYSKDSFVCSDESGDSKGLQSGTGDDLSSEDDELSQSKTSKAEYNLKQMKKQKEASKEMYAARHSSKFERSDKKANDNTTSNIKYKKIISQSIDSEIDSPGNSQEKTDNINDSIIKNSTIQDPLSMTVNLDNSNTNLKTDMEKICKKLHPSDDFDIEVSKPLSENEVNKNKSENNKTPCDDGNFEVNKNVSVANDEYNDDSISSLSEGEEIKNITSEYDAQLKELRKAILSVNSTTDSSSDNEESDLKQSNHSPISSGTSCRKSNTEKSSYSSVRQSPKFDSISKQNSKTSKSPLTSVTVDAKIHKLKSDISLGSLNKTDTKDLSTIVSKNESMNNINSSQLATTKSSNGNNVKTDSPKSQKSFLNESIKSEMNSSYRSPKDSKQNKRHSKSVDSSEVNIVDDTPESMSVEESASMKSNNTVIKTLTVMDTSPHQKNQANPRITDLASLFKSLPPSGLKLFSEVENSNTKKDSVARSTSDFIIESTKCSEATGKKRKDRNAPSSTWTDTAGNFQVMKKVKIQYPTRPITASDSGCTTSFSVVSLVKHPKQILKVDNQLQSTYTNFKNEMLYGKRVKREQSTQLIKSQQKVDLKKKENFRFKNY